MRLTLDQRHSLVNAVRRGINKKIVADVLNTSVKTVTKWCKRAFHRGKESFRDRPRKPKDVKVIIEVELAIIDMRTAFGWGTARIQQGLYCLPDYAKKVLHNYVENVSLSRPSINGVLKKHGINGYNKKYKRWKFFRAKGPNELWQIDLKGPYTVQGKKYWFLVCIDDFSRYLLLTGQFGHEPTTQEVTDLLETLGSKPKNILSDNGVQFKKQWKRWCKSMKIKPLFAHPYYPQDKGKVERAIRNISEEFIHLLRKFPEWLNGKIQDYKEWFNNKRFHRGVNNHPINLYIGS